MVLNYKVPFSSRTIGKPYMRHICSFLMSPKIAPRGDLRVYVLAAVSSGVGKSGCELAQQKKKCQKMSKCARKGTQIIN